MMKTIPELQRFITIGYLMLIPWLIWALAVEDICAPNCISSPAETLITRIYYAYALLPFIGHYVSNKLWRRNKENLARTILIIPIILLPIIVVMFININ